MAPYLGTSFFSVFQNLYCFISQIFPKDALHSETKKSKRNSYLTVKWGIILRNLNFKTELVLTLTDLNKNKLNTQN